MTLGFAVNKLRRHIPNLISLSRLALAAAFPFMSTTGRIWLVVLAALSDVLDGAVARRLHVESPLGNIVDPVTDKAFVVTVFVTFALEGAIGGWEITAILLRDIAVVAAVLLLLAIRRPEVIRRSHARIAGKATTVFQFAVFATLLFWQVAPFELVLIAAAVSAVAAADYLRHYWKLAHSTQQQHA